jgi:hypothetical protein
MRVIFLDFDGVLNTPADYEAMPGNIVIGDGPPLCRTKMALLNQLIARTEAKVVLSTSWRLAMSLVDAEAWLVNHGFVGMVIDSTPRDISTTFDWGSGRRPQRSDEILTWLTGHREVKSFVVLDDDRRATVPSRTVLTEERIGLTAAHVEVAIAILQRC